MVKSQWCIYLLSLLASCQGCDVTSKYCRFFTMLDFRMPRTLKQLIFFDFQFYFPRNFNSFIYIRPSTCQCSINVFKKYMYLLFTSNVLLRSNRFDFFLQTLNLIVAVKLQFNYKIIMLSIFKYVKFSLDPVSVVECAQFGVSINWFSYFSVILLLFITLFLTLTFDLVIML